jgi:hypothetical protein
MFKGPAMSVKLEEVNNLQIKTAIEDFKEVIARSFEEIKKVQTELKAQAEPIEPKFQAEQMESQSVKFISTALSIAQKDIKLPEKDKMGARAKYADLASCFDAIREIFGANGLSFQQPLIYIDGEAYLYTIIRHSSGEWIKSKAKLISYKVATTQEMQSFGGQLTYMRRYMLTSMLGLIGADEDRDAEDCDQRMEPRETYKKPAKRPMQVSTIQGSTSQGSAIRESNGSFINSEQASTILTLLTGRGDIKSRVLEELNIKSISGMLKKDYDLTLQRITAQVK